MGDPRPVRALLRWDRDAMLAARIPGDGRTPLDLALTSPTPRPTLVDMIPNASQPQHARLHSKPSVGSSLKRRGRGRGRGKQQQQKQGGPGTAGHQASGGKPGTGSLGPHQRGLQQGGRPDVAHGEVADLLIAALEAAETDAANHARAEVPEGFTDEEIAAAVTAAVLRSIKRNLPLAWEQEATNNNTRENY
jgi:hypothetical protein